MANHLANETSPYLLQHKNNPVDWHPWDTTALTRARDENKPILLSVGYSACHWCHVMAHECFENEHIATIMNENFINIKVDREERPDLDQIYQNVTQILTQSGGWPLTVFLTPDLKPFFGGTYFPPQDSHGRPGFPRVLHSLAKLYREQPEVIAKSAEQLTDTLKKMEVFPKAQEKTRANADDFEDITKQLHKAVDFSDGGFGGGPKFPNTMNLTYLWRSAFAFGKSDEALAKKSRDAVIFALECMVTRGLFDQVGGGFHRYCVDDAWTVPHFEKMLYDNALLLQLMAEVLLTPENALTKAQQELFIEAGRLTVGFLEREMFDPKAKAFYAALDADSEGVEGRFYVWDEASIKDAFKNEPSLFQSACNLFGVTPSGNFHDPHGHADDGMTVLHRATWAPHGGENIAQDQVDKVRHTLLEKRAFRTRPGTDTKILCSWNALMVSGLAWWAVVEKTLNSPHESKVWGLATNTLSQLFVLFEQEDGAFLSVHCEGKSRFAASLDDYSFLTRACLDIARFESLFGTTASGLQWNRAQKLCAKVFADFHDEENGGFFFTAKNHPDAKALIQRPKTLFDQAIPAGASVAFMNLLILGELKEMFKTPENNNAGANGSKAIDPKYLHHDLDLLTSFSLKNPYGVGELLLTLLMRFLEPAKLEAPVLEKPWDLLQNENIRQTPVAHFWWRVTPELKRAQVCKGQTCQLV